MDAGEAGLGGEEQGLGGAAEDGAQVLGAAEQLFLQEGIDDGAAYWAVAAGAADSLAKSLADVNKGRLGFGQVAAGAGLRVEILLDGLVGGSVLVKRSRPPSSRETAAKYWVGISALPA